MNFANTLEKIESSKLFQNFKKKYPDAEICAGFFIIDFLSNDNKNNIDYKVDDKIFTFDINERDEIFMNEDKLLKSPKYPELKPINKKVKIEVEKLENLAKIVALDNNISAKFHKIIAVLQKYNDEKQVWNLTCILENLIILNILIDSESGSLVKFERKSMIDLIRKK